MGGANAKSKRAAKLSNALDYAWLMDTTPPRPCEKNRHFRRISNISTIIYTLFALHECCPELPRELLPSIVLNMQIRVPYSYSSMFSLSAVKHLDSAQKIVLLGSGCVGKSAVVIQFIQNYFDGSYEGTESVDYYRKTMTIDGKTAAMDIYDIGSTPSEYNKEMREAICAGEAFIVCYSVTNRESFERVRGIIDDVYVKKNNVDVVPLTTMADLYDERVVTEAEGLELAKEYDCPFCETSALLKINTEEIFLDAVREKYRVKALLESHTKSSRKPKTVKTRD